MLTNEKMQLGQLTSWPWVTFTDPVGTLPLRIMLASGQVVRSGQTPPALSHAERERIGLCYCNSTDPVAWTLSDNEFDKL
jgi:hypothetical protein